MRGKDNSYSNALSSSLEKGAEGESDMHMDGRFLDHHMQGFLINDKQARNKLSDSKANVGRNNKLERGILGNYKWVYCRPGSYKLGDKRKWSVELERQGKRNYLSSR